MPNLLGLFIVMSFVNLVNAEVDYAQRYGVHDLYTKVVDNKGLGEERLYGLRNARMLFRNIMRGGANNAYHRTSPRANTNPLPADGLKNLCAEGFDHAIYLYSTNFTSAAPATTCRDFKGEERKLTYHNLLFNREGDVKQLLKLIHQALTQRQGIYLHCWNGWHASGYLSAISLIQFCGMKKEDAVRYWDRNTDGVNQDPVYENIRERIRRFLPDETLNISSELKQELCLN